MLRWITNEKKCMTCIWSSWSSSSTSERIDEQTRNLKAWNKWNRMYINGKEKTYGILIIHSLVNESNIHTHTCQPWV